MLVFNIDRDSSTPIFRQLMSNIIVLIDNGSMKEGERLPSTRSMAENLGVSRTTICSAFDELIAQGYLESRPGSYTTVRKRSHSSESTSKDRGSLIDWAKRTNKHSNLILKRHLLQEGVYATKSSDDLIDMSQLELDERLFPAESFRRSLNHALTSEGSPLLSYGNILGNPQLRDVISKRMEVHGITTSQDEIMITDGAQPALDTILRVYSKPGMKIAVENPTYKNFLPLIKLHRLEVVPIPVKEDGMDLDELEAQLKKNDIKFVYTMPNFQNPTGISTDLAHRERLIELCENHSVIIIEDGFEEEMKYFGKIPHPIKSLDKNGIVIYVGTFSKILFPGVRIGWIIADSECISRLTTIRRYTAISNSMLLQSAVANFCLSLDYEIHIRRMHRRYRRRMRTALKAFAENMPEGVKWTKPTGGYTVWITLPKSYHSARLFVEVMIRHGVLISLGDDYIFGEPQKRYIRISIANLDEGEVVNGIARLGEALKSLSVE